MARENPFDPVVEGIPEPFQFVRFPVRLQVYEGSAELLSWLLRRRFVGAEEVSIRDVVAQAKGAGKILEQANNLAIAAEILWLKSALLLPRPEPEAEETEGESERGELLQRQLLRNAAYGLAAQFLAERRKVWGQMFPRPTGETAPVKTVVLTDDPLSLLTEALRRVLARVAVGQVRPPRRRITVPQRIKRVLRLLREARGHPLPFEALCADCSSVLEIIMTFLAVLELIRQGYVGARQDNPFAPILVFLRE